MIKEGEKAFPNSMLCTVDFSDASRRALNNAIKIARTFKKRLYILNIMKPVENSFSPRYSIDFEKENERIAKENKILFEEFLAEFNFTDVDYETKVEKGDPASEILSFVSRMNIDLLFMGATGKTFLQRVLLGSVTEKIIRELPSSMVITKAESILNLKIDSDISEIEKHLSNAKRLEDSGYYEEAIHQLKLSIQKNDLHIPALNALSRLYDKIGDVEMSKTYRQKIDTILRRLWDKKIEIEIKKQLGY
jgi:nucleotide-binding universal stress UspA family protein